MEYIKVITRHTRKPKKYKFKILNSWNELNFNQAYKLAELSSNYSKQKTQLQFFFFLNNLKVIQTDAILYKNENNQVNSAFVFKRRLRRFVISEVDLVAITERFDWIYNGQESPDPLLTVSIMNKIGNNLTPPDDGLTNLTYEQYTLADTHFQRFISTKQLIHLDKLIGALYSVNHKFNPNIFHVYKKTFESIHFYEKLVILWYYIGSRKLLESSFPFLFSESESSKDTKSDPFLAWMKLTSSMLKTPADIQQTKKQLLWDVFSYLNEKIRGHKETQKKLKKNSNK